MSPSLDTVLRRRHLVLVLLRAAAAAVAVYGLIRSAQSVVVGAAAIAAGNSVVAYSVDMLSPLLGIVAPAIVLGLSSARLARWIVPAGLRLDGCPQCGYSLKNLKSPICPECGADVKR